MFSSINKTEELLSLVGKRLSLFSHDIETAMKELISSMMSEPISEFVLKEARVVNIRDFISTHKDKINVGSYDQSGYCVLSLNGTDSAYLVRSVMGYKNKDVEAISQLEMGTLSNYVYPYVEKVMSFMELEPYKCNGLIPLSRFTFSDHDSGVMQTMNVKTESVDIDIALYMSQSMLEYCMPDTDSMEEGADALLVELYAELYIKAMAIKDIESLRVGDLLNLPSPDNVKVRDSLTGEVIFTGMLGETSNLKSIKISAIKGELNV